MDFLRLLSALEQAGVRYVARAYRTGEFLIPSAFAVSWGDEEVNGFSSPGRMIVHR